MEDVPTNNHMDMREEQIEHIAKIAAAKVLATASDAAFKVKDAADGAAAVLARERWERIQLDGNGYIYVTTYVPANTMITNTFFVSFDAGYVLKSIKEDTQTSTNATVNRYYIGRMTLQYQ